MTTPPLRRLALALACAATLLAAGCAATPEPVDPAPVARAFADCLETYYAARVAGRPAEGPILARRSEAGGRLVRELEARGVDVPAEAAGAGLIGLVPLVERLLHTRTEDWTLAVVEPGASPEEARKAGEHAWPGSVLIASQVERRSGLTLELAGDRRVVYALLVHGEVACPPFAAWRARRPEEAPVLFVTDGAIYVARGAFGDPVPASGPGRQEPSLDDAITLAAAAMAFADEPDPARRDARLLVSLLDGPHGPLALRVLGATIGSPGAALALESFRRADVEPGAGEGWPARLARTSDAECHAIVKSALTSGGLLDTPRSP